MITLIYTKFFFQLSAFYVFVTLIAQFDLVIFFAFLVCIFLLHFTSFLCHTVMLKADVL